MNIEIEGTFFDINDYQITPREIGHGGFGKVYIARHNETNKEYAIKIIDIDDSFNGRKQMQFLRESLILHNLHHPSIVQYVGINFQSFQDPTKLQPSIITEYLKHGSLKAVLNLERLALADHEWNATKKYICLIGISDAMRYLHRHGILHRDLKPENVLLDGEFKPRICDFGLSRLFPQELTKSLKIEMTGNFGTVLYMAPEILDNNDDIGNYSSAVDVYAFGILAYEIVTGKAPYYELGIINPFALGIKVLNGYRPKFTENITKEMKELISKCLDGNPNERPTFNEIYKKLISDNYSLSYETIDKDYIDDYIESLNDENQESSNNNEKKIDKNPKDQSKESEYMDIIKLLVQNTKNINNIPSLLHKACSFGNIDLVKYLISLNQIDIKSKNILLLILIQFHYIIILIQFQKHYFFYNIQKSISFLKQYYTAHAHQEMLILLSILFH